MVRGSLCSGGSFTIDLIFLFEIFTGTKGTDRFKKKIVIKVDIQVIQVPSKFTLMLLIKRQYLKFEACYINVR